MHAIGTSVLESLRLCSSVLEKELSDTRAVYVHADSSAVRPVASRPGATRRTRRADLYFLCLQRVVRSVTIRVSKTPGAQNPPDLLTTYASADVLSNHIETLG